MQTKLIKNIIFIKSYDVFDFTKNLGQLAVEVTYTCGETQMLTTRSTKDNVRATYDFDHDTEFYDFVKFLKDNNIQRK